MCSAKEQVSGAVKVSGLMKKKKEQQECGVSVGWAALLPMASR